MPDEAYQAQRFRMPDETYQAVELNYRRCIALAEYSEALERVDQMIAVHREFSTFGLAELRAERARLQALVDTAAWEAKRLPWTRWALKLMGFGPGTVRE